MKSREIPIQDLYRNLQLEWISYYVRANIYQREIDIKRFKDICEMKKVKIDKFALRNANPSIFQEKEKLAKYLTEFYPYYCEFPYFQYTPKNKVTLSKWDKYYFYAKDVLVNHNGKDYLVAYNNSHRMYVGVDMNGNFTKIPYSKVRREIFDIFEKI